MKAYKNVLHKVEGKGKCMKTKRTLATIWGTLEILHLDH